MTFRALFSFVLVAPIWSMGALGAAQPPDRMEKKDYDKAIKDFDETIRLQPNYPGALNVRGFAYRAKGDYDKASEDFAEGIRLNRHDALVLNNLAWLHATCPEAKHRDGKKAIELANQACELTKWKEPHFIATLAAAFAETGDFAQAIKYQKQALEFKEFEKEASVQARARLKLYDEKKPYHQK